MNPVFANFVTWLLTFALHSTLALGGALAVTALLRNRALLVQEAALRWSMWAALVSATLQTTVLGSPWSWFAPLAPEQAPVVLLDPSLQQLPTTIAESAAPSPTVAVASVEAGWPWQELVGVGALVAAGCGLVWLVLVQRRLRTLLADRTPETEPRVLALAARAARSLGLQQSPRLSRSPDLATPIAFGWVRPEICLPERVDELDDASLRAMLAHELAHLRRADPAWMWAGACLQALVPWQPLLWFVRRRFAVIVELQCDAVAARHAGPTAVARCLLDVAEWLRPPRREPLGALGMAARPSALRQRVEAALRGAVLGEPQPRRVHLLGGLLAGLLTFAAPGLATDATDAGDGGSRAESAALPASAPPSDAASEAAPDELPLRELLAQLTAQQRELQREAAELRAVLAASPDSEVRALEALLGNRLQRLETQRQRLVALLTDESPR